MKHPKIKFNWDPNKDYSYLDNRKPMTDDDIKLTKEEIEIQKNKLKSKKINFEAFTKFVATI